MLDVEPATGQELNLFFSKFQSTLRSSSPMDPTATLPTQALQLTTDPNTDFPTTSTKQLISLGWDAIDAQSSKTSQLFIFFLQTWLNLNLTPIATTAAATQSDFPMTRFYQEVFF